VTRQTFCRVTTFGSHPDNDHPSTEVSFADEYSHLLAFIGRQSEDLGDHRHDQAVGPLVIQPIDFPGERVEVDRLVIVKRRLEDGKDTAEQRR
jgi:hypothetical protein